MTSRANLSLGERVHLASKDLRKILTPSIWAAAVGLVIIGVVASATFQSTTTIEEYGYHEYRLNSPDGPICDPGIQLVQDTDPARIMVLPGLGAEKAGIQNDDVIVTINGIKITNTAEVRQWSNLVPNVKPGDTVDVTILRNDEQLSFMVKTTADKENPEQPLIGIVSPISCDRYYFLTDEEKSLTLDAIRKIDSNLYAIYSLIGAFAIIFGYFLIWTLWKGRKLRNEIDDWEDAYLDQHYILTFETNTPKGSTNGEKIFNMAQAVFPELRKKDGKPEKWYGKVIGKDGYEFDCFQATNESEPELFVAKHFGKTHVELEKLQELCDITKKSKSLEPLKKKIKKLSEIPIMRVICVAEDYDEKFLKDSSREKVMDELDFEYPIDLILEKDGNYSVLCVES